jgi:PAS domain S-box-containing protein
LEKRRASLASGKPFENEARLRRARDGEYRWFLHRAVPLRDENGNIRKWYGISADIDDRKRAESLLTGEKRILEMVAKGDSLAQILDGLCRLAEEQAGDTLASILLVDGNRLWHGAAPSLPKAFTDAIDGIAIGPSAGTCGTAAFRGEQVIVEDITTDPLWADFREAAARHSLRASWSTPVFSSQGKVIATFAMYYRERRSPSLRDQEIIEQITHLAGVAIERKLTQEGLRRSEAHLSEAQKLSHTGSWAFSPFTGKTTYWSDEMFRLWGFDPQQGPPDPEAVLQRIHPDDRERMRELFERGFAGHLTADVTADHRIVLPDGTVKYHHGISHPVFDDAGRIVEYVGTALDVTERKRVEEILRRSETYLAEAQRLAHTGSWAWDPVSGKPIYWSEETFRIFGLDPQSSSLPDREEFLRLVHPEDRVGFYERLEKSFGEKTDFTQDYRLALPNGMVKHLRVIAHPILDEKGMLIECVGTAVDFTEGKRAEQERERLRQVEADLARINRVSMMGELTASLGHEVKQPIAAAVSNAEACLQWLAREQPNLAEVREAAAEMVKEARRAAEIMTRVRSLFRKEEITREVFDVNEIITDTVSLVRDEAYRRSISVRTELEARLPRILADRVQLQQVLMNLMLNGLEAMNDTGGELLIRSQRDEAGQVLISVSDAGVGLPIEESEKIFDAFFTTKPQGTGMGLAISRSIVESHGGRLWAAANSGQGATFYLALPNEVAERV